MIDVKYQAAMDRLGELAAASIDANRSAAISAMADCERALKRIVSRASLAEGFEAIDITQDRGPTIGFNGRLLASTEFETRGPKPLNILLEIFETQAGALIAVSSSVLAGGEGREDARVTVVPPQDDVQAMRFEVMQAFGWEVRARSMVRKLGWSLRLDVA